jgi:hypothetical protein
MIRCSTATIALVAAGCIAFSASAQSINLTGIVKDSATQQGIGGAKVKLAVHKDSAVTDASGAYTITGSAVRFFSGAQTEFLRTPMFARHALRFGIVSASERVKIDVYDVSGRRVAGLLDRDVEQGDYQINPYLSNLASNIYFVKIQIGSQSSMFTMPLAGKLAAAAGGVLRKAGGSSDAALAKSAAALDTLVVTANGYKTASLPISSYTGTNNLLLASVTSAGHLGYVTFDNASYSGCQGYGLIIVNDSDLTAATVPVRLTSKADTAGIAFNLQKDPTTFGQYVDTIWFNIFNSNAAKHVIKVRDTGNGGSDELTIYYHDQNPDTMLYMNGITWNGSTGQVGPGASIYSGITVKATVNLNDADLTDSVEFIIAKNDSADTVGIQLALHAVPGSGGSYSGLLGFSTVASNQALGIIKVKGKNVLAGENITLIYDDLTPPSRQVGSICTWRPMVGNVAFDTLAYFGTTKKATISLYDDDIADSTVVVTVKSKKNATGIHDTLKVTSTGSLPPRVFSGTLGFSTTASQPGKTIDVLAAGDSVSVTYIDTVPDSVVVTRVPWSAQ